MCPMCGRPYGKRRRCYFCTLAHRKTGAVLSCAVCNREFYAQRNQIRDVERNSATYCSRACKYEGLRRREPKVGHALVTTTGYVSVYLGKGKRQLEHRLVMERILGRPLQRREEVHHINGDRTDNRPDNLRILSPGEHQRFHDFGARQRATRPVLICKWCGAVYTRKPSKVSESSYCSHACRMNGMWQARRKRR